MKMKKNLCWVNESNKYIDLPILSENGFEGDILDIFLLQQYLIDATLLLEEIKLTLFKVKFSTSANN